MSVPRIFESEYRFCLILRENEPIRSTALAKLCGETPPIKLSVKLNPQQDAPQVRWRCEDEGVQALTPMEDGSSMVKVLRATKGGVLVYAEYGGTAAVCRIYCAEHEE